MELAYEYSHLTHREFAEQAMGGLKGNLGVDLLPIYTDASLSTAAKIRRARATLLEAVIDAADRASYRVEFARSTPEADSLMYAVVDEAVEIEPNLALPGSDAQFVMNLEGEALKNYLFTLTKRFENMSTAKTPGALALEMVRAGLLAVGVPAARGAITALFARSTLVGAARAGITSVGMGAVIVGVVTVLATLLFYLFSDNPKKILGMVVNDLEENFIVKDWQKGQDGQTGSHLFMQHGDMAQFMEDYDEGLGSNLIQIHGRVSFGPDDPDNVVFAGIYFADRNVGLRGAEGVMVFSSTTTPLRFAHMFAVPYSNDNGTNIALVEGDPGDLEPLFRNLYDTRGVKVEKNEQGYRLRARVNDPRGGVVGCIASISKMA